jgi:hypothetical protein
MEFNPQFTSIWNTLFPSKDNEAAKRRLRRRIIYTLRKPTMQLTKLAAEGKRGSG